MMGYHAASDLSILEKIEGILFDFLEENGFGISQLTSSNIRVLKNLHEIVLKINGAVVYGIDGLNVLGEITDRAMITVQKNRFHRSIDVTG